MALAHEEARVLAKNEYTSLEYLRDHWPGSEFGDDFVAPLAFVETSNLLITEELPGEHLHAQMRRRLLKKKLSFRSVGVDPLVPCFARIGFGKKARKFSRLDHMNRRFAG